MIYFLSDGEYVKIGFSDNVTKRISQIQTANPKDLSVELIIDGDYAFEQKIHNDLKEFSVKGEWFYYSDSVKKYIDKLKSRDLRWSLGFLKQEIELNALKKARINAGLSLNDVSEILGLTKQSVFEIEKRFLSGSVSIKTVHKFAKAIGCKFEFRFVRKQQESKAKG